MEQLSLAQDLLETAQNLSRLDPGTEAAFRRCENWPEPQRGRVARQFGHKRMRDTSAEQLKKQSPNPSDAHTGLMTVCRAFVRLQDQRHAADCDVNATMGRNEAAPIVVVAEEAFGIWGHIKRDPPVQDYLLSLLFKDRT